MKYIKLIITVISGASAWVLNKVGLLYPALIILFVSMVFDYLTGMMASKYEAITYPDKATGLSSKKGLQGILKKLSYLIIIAVAILVDFVIINLGGILSIELTGNSYFSLLITVWFFVNEWISILENCGRMGVKLPDWIFNIIMEIKKGAE